MLLRMEFDSGVGPTCLFYFGCASHICHGTLTKGVDTFVLGHLRLSGHIYVQVIQGELGQWAKEASDKLAQIDFLFSVGYYDIN